MNNVSGVCEAIILNSFDHAYTNVLPKELITELKLQTRKRIF